MVTGFSIARDLSYLGSCMSHETFIVKVGIIGMLRHCFCVEMHSFEGSVLRTW